jgi:hypothetical protein
LSEIDRSSTPKKKKKISQETSELNYTISQMELTDIYRIHNPTTAECTFFSAAYNTFTKSIFSMKQAIRKN